MIAIVISIIDILCLAKLLRGFRFLRRFVKKLRGYEEKNSEVLY